MKEETVTITFTKTEFFMVHWCVRHVADSASLCEVFEDELFDDEADPEDETDAESLARKLVIHKLYKDNQHKMDVILEAAQAEANKR